MLPNSWLLESNVGGMSIFDHFLRFKLMLSRAHQNLRQHHSGCYPHTPRFQPSSTPVCLVPPWPTCVAFKCCLTDISLSQAPGRNYSSPERARYGDSCIEFALPLMSTLLLHLTYTLQVLKTLRDCSVYLVMSAPLTISRRPLTQHVRGLHYCAWTTNLKSHDPPPPRRVP